MRSLLATLFVVCLVALFTPAAFAIHYWVGFSGVQKKSASRGGVHGTLYYVDALVGSDETNQNATPHTFVVYMSGAGPAGTCPQPLFNEVTTKVHPAVAVTRFQIFYPSRKSSGPRDTQFQSTIPVDYNLKAHTTGDFQVNHQFVMKFPTGGTISCERLQPPPPQ